MKIDKIELTNFRNLQAVSIPLGRQLTVLIGRNGVGKTNVLNAITRSLSFIFSKKGGTNQYQFIASSDRKVIGFKATDATYLLDKGDYQYPIKVEATATLQDGSPISWGLVRESASKGLSDSYFHSARDMFWQKHESVETLPVLAYFSDSYPHILSTLGQKIQSMLDAPYPLPQNVAYYKWDEELNCQQIWLQYFRKQWKKMKWDNDDEAFRFVDAINKKLIEYSQCTGDINAIPEFAIQELTVSPRGSEDLVEVVFENGERIPFSQLPQGYNRILSIVFDLACRAYLLGKTDNVLGICIIDEIELHLHPRLAQEVLNRLLKMFPDMQFVVSTHSPLVVSNINQDASAHDTIIYRMSKDTKGMFEIEELHDTYGIDVNTILESHMDTPHIESELQELKNAFVYWKEGGNEEKAARVLALIGQMCGKDSPYYKKLEHYHGVY